MQVTQGLRRAVQVNAGGVATIFGERRRTWGEVAERIARLAGGLQGLGLQAGDRVAILALNSDRYFEYLFAVPWAGGVVVPLNTRWAAPENVFALNDSGAAILLVDDAFAPMLEAFAGKLESVQTVVHMGDGPAPAGARAFEALIQGAAAVPDAGRYGDDLAGIYYTGGTTGRSKGVMLSQRNVGFNAAQAIGAFRFHQGTRWLHSAPMFHLADGSSTLAVTAVAGSHVFVERFEPVAVLEAIQRDRPTFCLFVPTMMNMLVNHPDLERYDLSSVREVLYGASPMPEALLRTAMARLMGWQLIQGYGMTELSPLTTTLDWKFHELEGEGARRLKSCGRAVYGVEVKIVDTDDNEVPRGTVGEIAVKGDNVMLGYWNQPELTAAAVRDGWMHTGDAAWMDEDGFIYIVDRVKDMIITGGENVYSAEVEDAIYRHPEVAEAAVIGIPSEDWGEQVHAVVVPKPGRALDAEAIIAHCRTLIAGYKCPRSVEIRHEPLPLSGAGKILKPPLREPYWRGRERQVS